MTTRAQGARDSRIVFTCHGARIEVRLDRAAAGALPITLPPGAVATEVGTIDSTVSVRVDREEARRYHVERDGRQLASGVSPARAAAVAASALHAAVARHASERLFVHAGVVGWQGRALVIPGPSMSGKTTLVRAMIEAGATYYSDEYAVFDSSGRVHAYPRVMNVRDSARIGSGGDVSATGQATAGPVTSEAEGGENSAGLAPLIPGLIVVARFRPGAVWAPERLSARETLFGLIANTAVAGLDPQLTLATLTPVAIRTPAVAGERGDTRSMIEELFDLMRAASARAA